MSPISLSGTVLGTVDAVLVGRAREYARGERSAIDKRVVTGPVPVGELGLVGDEQGDPKHHGGPAKAVHHYARDHYRFWRAQLGDLPVLDSPGAFGENLSTTGITENDLCLGDRIRVGTVLLRVSQGRRPCWKLGVRFGVPDMARRVLVAGRTGWYYAVDEPGELAAGDEFSLIDRPYPEWPLSRLIPLVLHRGGTVDDLRASLHLPLPTSWRETLERKLSGRATDAELVDFAVDAEVTREDWME
jgi:MOSC domain-containing protein YiiM